MSVLNVKEGFLSRRPFLTQVRNPLLDPSAAPLPEAILIKIGPPKGGPSYRDGLPYMTLLLYPYPLIHSTPSQCT